uniref:Uncharacterized protein n=1 Tax=Rhizophora mucronata TaxID=61149 RepID=A0A2P2NE95_RHIMU
MFTLVDDRFPKVFSVLVPLGFCYL